MIKYKLNGETFDVPPEDEEQFKLDNPGAEKTEKVSEEIVSEEYTPQNGSTDESESTDPLLVEQNLETDPSQNNQEQEITDDTILKSPEEVELEVDSDQEEGEEEYHGIENIIDEKGDFSNEEKHYQWSVDPNKEVSSIKDNFKIDEGKQEEEKKYIEGLGEVTVEKLDTSAERGLLTYNLSKIDYKDWDSMPEEDKNKINGWENLGFEEKEKWEEYFELNRPIEIYEEENENADGEITTSQMLGDYDLSDPTLWNREWDYKEPFFEQLLKPISGNYTIKKGGGGAKWTKGEAKQWDWRNYKWIRITHNDTDESILIKESSEEYHQKNPEKYAKYVNDFLTKTLSEEDKIKLNKNQHWLSDLYAIDEKKNIDVSSIQEQEIIDDVTELRKD